MTDRALKVFADTGKARKEVIEVLRVGRETPLHHGGPLIESSRKRHADVHALAARAGLQRNLAMVRVCDFTHDREAEPRAVRIRRRAEERFEHPAARLRWNAWAVVEHAHGHAGGVGLHG